MKLPDDPTERDIQAIIDRVPQSIAAWHDVDEAFEPMLVALDQLYQWAEGDLGKTAVLVTLWLQTRKYDRDMVEGVAVSALVRLLAARADTP